MVSVLNTHVIKTSNFNSTLKTFLFHTFRRREAYVWSLPMGVVGGMTTISKTGKTVKEHASQVKIYTTRPWPAFGRPGLGGSSGREHL